MCEVQHHSAPNEDSPLEQVPRPHHSRRRVIRVKIRVKKPESSKRLVGTTPVQAPASCFDVGSLMNQALDSPLSLSATPDLEPYYHTLQLSEEQIAELSKLNITDKNNDEWRTDANGLVVAASFTQLFLAFTDPDAANLDFQQQVIITFPSYTSPAFFLGAIFTRYFIDISDPNVKIGGPDALPEVKQKKQKQIQDRIVRIFTTWFKVAAYQFDDTMLAAIHDFSIYLRSQPSKTLLAQILENSVQQLLGQRDKVQVTAKMEIPDTLPLPSKPEGEWTILDIPAIELARQLTQINSQIFTSIGPMELLTAIWGQKKGGGAPNVDRLIRQFDVFSRYVAASVIQSSDDAHERGRIVKYWIDVATELFEHQDYHGMFAVISGLGHRSVERLAETQKFAMKTNAKRKKSFATMKTICDISGDYRNYRPIINQAGDRPCVPFIGCLQKDLIYISEGSPNKIDGLINFNKCRQCVSLLKMVEKFTNQKFHYHEVPGVIHLLTSIPEPPDTIGLMTMSMAKEKKKK